MAPTGNTVTRDGAGQPAAPRKLLTLKKRADFLRASGARRQAMPGFVVQARERDADETGTGEIRVGYTCSKKVGNAVARNRAKRRLRALAHETLPSVAREGWDYVLIGRRDATADLAFDEMRGDLCRAIDRLHGTKP
jgi:ribonuclease P protein component